MAVLVIDIGGNNVKLGCDGAQIGKVSSGPDLVPAAMVEGVRGQLSLDRFDRISIGCPGPVRDGVLLVEPVNLGKGWVGFDFAAAFGLPTRLVNDAAMQALGSWESGKMLFLGLGTGLGAALVVDGLVLGLEVAHLPYRPKRTYEDCVATRGYRRLGRKRWEQAVLDVVDRLRRAMVADEVVLGGGNTKRLTVLPPFCRAGDNARALVGGMRLWATDMRIL